MAASPCLGAEPDRHLRLDHGLLVVRTACRPQQGFNLPPSKPAARAHSPGPLFLRLDPPESKPAHLLLTAWLDFAE
jgi:hypothetical protein